MNNDKDDFKAPLAQQAGLANGCGYRSSPREEAEKAACFHADRASKSSQAADFLRDHPEFNDFIRLLREGVLSI